MLHCAKLILIPYVIHTDKDVDNLLISFEPHLQTLYSNSEDRKMCSPTYKIATVTLAGYPAGIRLLHD